MKLLATLFFLLFALPSQAEIKFERSFQRYFEEPKYGDCTATAQLTVEDDAATLAVTAEPVGGEHSCNWLQRTSVFSVLSFERIKGTYCNDSIEIIASRQDLIDEFGPVKLIVRSSQAWPAPYCQGISGGGLVIFGSVGHPVVWDFI